MSKKFRPWQVDDVLLLPPSVTDFVPAGHFSHFVRDLVREQLDLSAITGAYREDRGYPAYDPHMMTALLLYAYCRGVYSSRRVARGCEERLDFMAVTAMNRPDFRTISDFRKRHLAALSGLFVQVLRLCQEAGLVKLGHVALDGTKIKANASKHKAMSYGRMNKAEAELSREVADWLAAADAVDAEEDARFGADRRGDEMPDWLADKAKRLEKIRQAKAALEAEARAEAAAKEASEAPPSKKRPGRKPKTPPGVPKDSAQRNFTDPDSRIMKAGDGFIQGYNAQAAVDSGHQVIVACALANTANDQNQLAPMAEAIAANTGRAPREFSADAGYCSEANLEALEEWRTNAYVATGRQKHGQASATGPEQRGRGARVEAMARKLRRGGWRSRYRLRKQTVEPVIGQIKEARGFRRFLLRGIEKVGHEWGMVCTAHNLLKLATAAAQPA
ncbi:MAG: IS1182 family transposase [Alphaproteobacteria bacterium]